MPYKNRRSSYTNFILFFVFLKIGLNAVAMAHYGFHRDELLHLALGDHLAWGYKEVPPFIALLAKLSTTLFGSSVFAARIFSTICAGLNVWFVGLITVEFGGKMFAITLACLSFIFAPAFLGSNYLFQPVVFDQLWWVLTVWLLVRYINTHAIKYLYFIGVAIGLGILTKYTMLFFAGSLILGLAISKQRRLLWNKHVAGAVAVAFVIVLPNLIWQIQHHWPIFTHMAALQKEQLEYIKAIDFTMQQLLCMGVALFVWMTGLFFLFFSFKLRKYQSLAFGYLLIFIFLLQMDGKSYYLFGAYPMLFAAGGYGFERWIKTSVALRTTVVALFTLPNLIILPAILPVLPLKPTLALFDYINNHTHFIKFMTVWEDHKHHATTQDYADMLGWEEMVAKTAKVYYSLTPEDRLHTMIFADNYGEGGAFAHFGEVYKLPEVVCLNSSFALWAPADISPKNIIYVSDDCDVSDLQPMADSINLMAEVSDPLAREYGTGIFLIKGVKPEISALYQQHLKQKLEK